MPAAKICFLFNHDQIHQVAHSLPIALELAETGQATVVLAVTYDSLETEIRRLAGDAIARLRIVRLDLNRAGSRIAAALFDFLAPARRLAIYRDNLDFFRQFDAVVISEKTSLLLKTRYGLHDVKLIHTRHGAGDRAIGFNRESALFDLVLVSGPKIRDRLIRDAGVLPDRIAIVGYSKFDLLPSIPPRLPVQENGRPTVLYNPHPSPHLSSWYRFGAQVLEQFRQSGRYNLIFAPHVMLFRRKIVFTVDKLSAARVRRPAQDCYEAPNMLIDLGSSRSVDMTYTQAADIYLGDVSSQIYEFLVRPRPCLFLDAHDTDWKNDPDYRHWRAGPVITDASDVIAAVDKAMESHPAFLPVQHQLLAETFSVESDPASQRAAQAILEFLGNRKTNRQ